MCKKVFRSTFGKLQAVWNKQSRSTLSADYIKSQLGNLFIIPGTTRWNALFDACVRVQEFINTKNDNLRAVFNYLDVRPLSTDEETFVSEYVTVMEPIAQTLDLLQGDLQVSAGYLVPSLHHLLDNLRAINLPDLQYTAGVVSDMKGAVMTRFVKELSSPEFSVAACLHPLFKTFWVSENEIQHVRENMRDALEKYDIQRKDAASGK